MSFLVIPVLWKSPSVFYLWDKKNVTVCLSCIPTCQALLKRHLKMDITQALWKRHWLQILNQIHKMNIMYMLCFLCFCLTRRPKHRHADVYPLVSVTFYASWHDADVCTVFLLLLGFFLGFFTKPLTNLQNVRWQKESGTNNMQVGMCEKKKNHTKRVIFF